MLVALDAPCRRLLNRDEYREMGDITEAIGRAADNEDREDRRTNTLNALADAFADLELVPVAALSPHARVSAEHRERIASALQVAGSMTSPKDPRMAS